MARTREKQHPTNKMCWYCWSNKEKPTEKYKSQLFHTDCLNAYRFLHPEEKPSPQFVVSLGEYYLYKSLFDLSDDINGKRIVKRSPNWMACTYHQDCERIAIKLRFLRKTKIVAFSSVPNHRDQFMEIELLRELKDIKVF